MYAQQINYPDMENSGSDQNMPPVLKEFFRGLDYPIQSCSGSFVAGCILLCQGFCILFASRHHNILPGRCRVCHVVLGPFLFLGN